MTPLKISIIGTGYVGLVSGTCLASKGHFVNLLDVKNQIVDSINYCKPPIYENGLEDLLSSVIKNNRLKARIIDSDSLSGSDIIMICVGTPSSSGQIDLTQLKSASEFVGKYLKSAQKFTAVVVKSTVVPGTTDTFVREIIEENSLMNFAKSEFGLGMNPEFLREGSAVEDFMNADRIVIGADDLRTRNILEQLYAPWSCDKLIVNSRTAEMIKYANNCMLALQISASNELANIAAAIGGIDYMDVHRGITLDNRWNPVGDNKRLNPGILSYLIPGCGFGGSCFPKDVEALRSIAINLDIQPRILQSILDVNVTQSRSVLSPLISFLQGNLKNKKILVLGLAFKPETDDIRESASLRLISELISQGAKITAHDPVVNDKCKNSFNESNFKTTDDWKSEISDSDAIILATSWKEYAQLPEFLDSITGKIILDTRRFFKPDQFQKSRYLAVGYRPIQAPQ